MQEIYTVRDNFLLVKEHQSTKGNIGRTVIVTSGYTITPEAVKQNWFLTQFKTLLHQNRSKLPDPWILSNNLMAMYEELDCNAYTLFFLPQCKGLKYAIEEIADYLDWEFFPNFPHNAIIGHSKGGLFAAGLTKSLDINTNIAIVTPAFGTIMGDELLAYEAMDKYLQTKTHAIEKLATIPQVKFYKKIIGIVCSGRSIDYDMAIGSKFLTKDLDLSNLHKHNTLLITAKSPKKYNLSDLFFIQCGKLVELNEKGDGMVSLENQRFISNMVDEEILIEATHQSALYKAKPYLKEFLYYL